MRKLNGMMKSRRAGVIARSALACALVFSMLPTSALGAAETATTGTSGTDTTNAAVAADGTSTSQETATVTTSNDDKTSSNTDATNKTAENTNGTSANADGTSGNADKDDNATHKLAADNSADEGREHDISAAAEKDGAFADGAELSVSELTGDDFDDELNDLAGSLDGYLIDDALLGFELACTDESEPVHMTISGDWANGLDGYVLYHKSDSGWEQVAYGVADEDTTNLDEDATSLDADATNKNVTETNKDTDETGKYVSFDADELGCFAFVKVSSAEDDIETTETTTAFAVYSGTDGSLSFYKRTSVPSAGSKFNGKYATEVYTGIENTGENNPGWYSNRTVIHSVKVVDEGISPTSTYRWFYGCKRMTSCDVKKLDTANVTDMGYMFGNCSSLTSLDVSGFKTSAATDMSYMFSGCSSLTTLDVSGFETAKVTSMLYMFNYCSSLTTLDVSGFETANVTDMGYMFYNCSSLTTLDVSGWNTASVTSMRYMFGECSSLTSLDLSSWDTANVTSVVYMFSDMNKLQEVSLGASWKWVGTGGYLPTPSSSYITGADGNWYDDAGTAYAARAIPSNVAATYYAAKSLVPVAFAVYSATDGSLSFYKRSSVPSAGSTFNGKTATKVYTGIENTGTSQPWNSYAPSIKNATIVDEGISPTSTCLWFDSCFNLTSCDLLKLDTSKVTNMGYMFQYCSSLTSLDVSGFETANVTNMNGMFFGCSGLTSLDVSGFETAKVTDMNNMFANCTSLTSLDVSGFETAKVTNMNGMFVYCTSLTLPLDLSGFETANVTDMGDMFSGCSFTSLDVSGFETANVTNMSGMFFGCESLTSLDLSGWNTANVTNMSWMFYGMNKLQEVSLGANWKWVGTDGYLPTPSSSYITGADGNWYDDAGTAYAARAIPSNVAATYYAAKSLVPVAFAVYSATDGSLSFYKRSSVPSAGSTFNGKTATAVYTGIENTRTIPPWNSYAPSIKNATIVDEGISPTSTCLWFDSCSNLTSCDLLKLDTSKVTNMGYMFQYCSSLTSLDVSGFETANVTNMSGMFFGCSGLTSLDVSGFETAKVTDMNNMFANCTSLTSLDVSGFETANVTNMSGMFFGCESLTSLDLSGWNTANVTNMSWMFYGMNKLQKVSLGANWKWVGTDGYLPTPSSSYITGADGNWYNEAGEPFKASSIPSNTADTYHAETPTAFAVYSTDDGSLCFYKRSIAPTAGSSFNGKTATAVYTGIENTGENNPGWYSNRTGIQSVKVVDEGISPTSTHRWFYGCSSMTSCDVKKLDTSKVTNMGYMFDGCSSLTSLDVSGFETANVTDMNNMFSDCSSLTSLDVSGFETANVTNMGYMFYGCSKLNKMKVGLKTNLSKVTGSEAVTGVDWIKDSTKDTVAGTAILTAYSNLTDGETETFYKGASLSIIENVTGYESGTLKQTITISLAGSDAPESTTYTVTSGGTTGASGTKALFGGKVSFEIANGQTLTLKGLPQGVSYTVTKKTLDGYDQSWTGSTTGTIGTAAVSLTSTDAYVIQAVLPEAGACGLGLLGAGALAAGACGLRARRIRRGR